MENKKLKVGLISFAHGHGFSYLNSFLQLPEVEVVGISHENRSRVEHVLENHSLTFYEDYNDLLATDIDAVAICSENVHHAEMTIAAAKAKKHVLCEKPLGLSIEEMQLMIDTCKENDVQLMTAFPCRYLTAVANAKKAIDRGDIGDIIAINGTNRGTMPGSWFVDPAKSGGGALLDHTVHVMDLMNWMIGANVTEVYAYAATRFFDDLDVDDTGMIHVKFDNGAFGVIDTSWSRPKSFMIGGDVNMEIIGTKGSISVESLAQVSELYSEDLGKGRYLHWGDNSDHQMIIAFVDALLNDKPVPITGEDGMKSAIAALAGYRSNAIGQPVPFIE